MSLPIEEIRQLSHWNDCGCKKCGTAFRVHALQIYAKCPNCGLSHECRAFGGTGTEIQDIIDAVLEWAGEGEEFEAVMTRHEQIIGDKKNGDV